MKKIFIIAAIVIVVFACSRKTVVTTETKTQTTVTENKIEAKEETALADERLTSNTPVKTDPGPNDMLVAGQRVYVASCGRCHELYSADKFAAQRWKEILKKELPKAKLNAEQSKQVTAYVMANAKK